MVSVTTVRPRVKQEMEAEPRTDCRLGAAETWLLRRTREGSEAHWLKQGASFVKHADTSTNKKQQSNGYATQAHTSSWECLEEAVLRTPGERPGWCADLAGFLGSGSSSTGSGKGGFSAGS